MSDIHVYPLNDTYEHQLEGDQCPCRPKVEMVYTDQGIYCGRLIVHNAFDGRHILEQKTEGKVM